jgi:hypothetical protein
MSWSFGLVKNGQIYILTEPTCSILMILEKRFDGVVALT